MESSKQCNESRFGQLCSHRHRDAALGPRIRTFRIIPLEGAGCRAPDETKLDPSQRYLYLPVPLTRCPLYPFHPSALLRRP